LDTGFVLACCWFAHKLAKTWWGEREGRAAALLMAFFTAFYLPAATIPFAVDGLLLLPHLAAVYFAFRGRALTAGFCCALGLLTNVKALFVTATCALWLLTDLPLFAAGLAAPLAIAAVILTSLGALPDFYQQVWQWGLVYTSTSTFETALKHTADWLAFHAALLAGVILARHEAPYRFGTWFLLSCAPLALGNHFAPRYFFQLLPVMVILASRGIVLGLERYKRPAFAALLLLLLIPFIRFGPRYADLTLDNLLHKQPNWSDVAMDLDSQQAANIINASKQTNDSLFIWGYRPDIYVYTRLTPPEKFSDSQPLDGVPADRHLQSDQPNPAIPAKANRAVLIKSEPTFLVDGLGLLNPKLSPEQFPDLAQWLTHYRLIATTKLTRIYRHI
jgi:hypothetical protein